MVPPPTVTLCRTFHLSPGPETVGRTRFLPRAWLATATSTSRFGAGVTTGLAYAPAVDVAVKRRQYRRIQLGRFGGGARFRSEARFGGLDSGLGLGSPAAVSAEASVKHSIFAPSPEFGDQLIGGDWRFRWFATT
jgi:hypothetical protein